MFHKIIFFLACLFIVPIYANAAEDYKNQTIDEILEQAHNANSTKCASNIFAEALMQHSAEIDGSETELKVRAWAKNIMNGDGDVLGQVLKCPELQNIDDNTTVIFDPITYNFPDSNRTITINYTTQKKVLKQKLLLSRKRSLPTDSASPGLMDPDDPAKYMNTEPAWYAIMVVQHDSLKEFVGEGKNNTLSVKYLTEHIDEIYPQGYYCTSRSAWANDSDTINQVVNKVVDVEGDTNDYYVAGDINLEWIMYAEIAAEVIITVATMGAGEAAIMGMKGTRAAKTGVQLAKNTAKLKQLDHVADYAKGANKIAQTSRKAELLGKNASNAKKYEKALRKINQADNAADAAKYRKEAEEIMQAAKKIDPSISDDLLRSPERMKTEAKRLTDSIPDMEKKLAKQKSDLSPEKLKDVDNYIENTQQLEEVLKYRRELGAYKRPQTGNVFTRNLKKLGAFGKSLRAANTGSKTLNKAGKVARAGMSSRSAKIKNWLFDTTLKHGARLAKFERDMSFAAGLVMFLGDMYDRTSSTSKEFTNGIEFKPFCLLSADDLEGQDNVVNYGMWLMWVGNSTDPADDDAAYLQSMDFASKFYYQLDEFQEEYGANCNVDIYVVRPIIRLDETNENDPKGELFYLFMNEIPWSTAEQFGEKVTDIEEWERIQKALEEQDPKNKYQRNKEEKTEQQPEQVATDENTEKAAEGTAE